VRWFLEPPPWTGYRLTARRLFNLYLNRWEHRRRRIRLRSLPIKLIIEPINACNLRCPYCFTGAGLRGRPRSAMPLALYRRLLDEIGDALLELEAFNWGEPLLNPDTYAMIADATARGISTTLNTNLSLPFDAEKAERLVSSGLTVLSVSIDGARQETYERYRVRGHLATVLRNCELVVAAKRRLGSATPRVNWEFHAFPHNVDDYEEVVARAAALGMHLLAFKGAVPGPEWDPGGPWRFCAQPLPLPCTSLWAVAVVHNDGGVAPCNGTFYSEDDLGQLALEPGSPGAPTFREVWNGPRYQAARRFFHARSGTPEERQLVCFDCPNTTLYERWRRHEAAGGRPEAFDVGFTTNDGWNYFWNRRPTVSVVPRARIVEPNGRRRPPHPTAVRASAPRVGE
jgi:organic radical activating enzyme